ncbi:hypothetical protein EFW17_06925 [Halostreptopolyspora alba]|uniref:Septum formation initiator n=1 Tax=Halostreptopolyspora alba TaxID=2487137 RepID=A0A3N0ED74_9ACTN|nr:hypothetical protein EFW17_06925 [Nocardiopsaceae bacterium YIM 96095]
MAGWVAAAAVAVAASVAAVSVARGGLLSHPAQPMTDQEVQEELAEGPPPASPTPTGDPADGGGNESGDGSPSPATSHSPTGAQPSGQLGSVPDDADSGENEAVFPSDGGTVLARCADGVVELVWWVAEQGYSIDDVTPGPAPEAEVEFEGGGGEFELSVSCADGEPHASVEGDD